MIPTKEDILNVKELVSPHVHNTPVLHSSAINKMVGCEVFFKCENFQRMGAFKMRGATNAMLQLTSEQRERGVTTHSSGNFAQAVALAAKSLGIKATIVMPANAPSVKKEAVEGYGAKIIICESTLEAREAGAQEVVDQTGATFIHPSNDIDVINGNSTAAQELFEDHPDLNSIFAPVGGGGLVAGTALATHHLSKAKTYGGEPSGADDAFQSLIAGYIIPPVNINTIADGLRTQLGDQNFPIIKELVEDIFLVEEDEIVAAMRLVWERMKIIIEPSSAVAFAALYKNRDLFKGQKVGIIVSGGNVDVTKLPF